MSNDNVGSATEATSVQGQLKSIDNEIGNITTTISDLRSRLDSVLKIGPETDCEKVPSPDTGCQLSNTLADFASRILAQENRLKGFILALQL